MAAEEDHRHSLPFTHPSSSPRQISLSYQPPMPPFLRPYFTSMSMPDLTLAEIAATSSSIFPSMESSPPPSSPPLSPEVYSPDASHFPDSSALSWPQPHAVSRGPPGSSSDGAINPFDLDLRQRHHSDNDIFAMYPHQAGLSRQHTSSVAPSRPNPQRTSYYTLVHPNATRSSPAPTHGSPVWQQAMNDTFDFSPSPSPLVRGRPSSMSGADQLLSPAIKNELFSPEQVTLGMFPDDIQYGQTQEDQGYYVANAPSPPDFFLPPSLSLDSHAPSQPPSLENSPAHATDELPSGDEPIQVITRKSRGRQVPNVFQLYGGFSEAAAYIASGGSKDPNARTAICFIPGCGACFVRNEHLKRHLISIHSQDKPWYCPYAKCGKNFNRRDNLVQHVHTAHIEHGHGSIPIPQNPYNCPFPDVVQEVYTDRNTVKTPKQRKPKVARKGSSKYASHD